MSCSSHSCEVLEPLLTSSMSALDNVARAVDSLGRPLISNLLREYDNQKFHCVMATSRILRSSAELLGGEEGVSHLMRHIGFDKSGDCWLFSRDREFLKHADVFLTWLEDSIAMHRAKQMSAGTSSASVLDPLGPTMSKGELARKRMEDERAAATQRLLELRRQDAEALKQAKLAEQEEERRLALVATDFESVKHLIEVCKLTLHRTGRLRNASFEAKHFTLRRMAHDRCFACSTCANECLEAHWHVVNGSMLYSYVVHLSPDADAVLHVGYEHSYQYNGIPGTEHFRKMVWMTTKKVNECTGQLDLLKHLSKPVESCVYCGVLFSKLLL